MADLQSEFHQFVTKMASADENWKLWKQFTFEDCSAFASLYLAVRSGNWLLRVKSLKDMAPLFFAFHRPHYRKLISHHLADLVTIPSEILHHFQAGGFTVSITGKGWHSVAIDKAHEMLINKDLKSAIVRPGKENMNRLSLYLGHRAKLLHNIKHELDAPKATPPPPPKLNMIDLQDKSAQAIKPFRNIQEMITKVTSGGLLPDQSDITQLRNPFTGKLVTPELQQDMLNFRKTGQQDYEVYVEYCYLKVSSVEPQLKRRKVNTFSDQKASRQLTDTERDKKTVSMCLKKCLRAINSTGIHMPFQL